MPFNLKDIFLQSFKAANPDINILPGFQVYDTMINPNVKAFASLESSLNTLEENLDYSKFFDDEGILISEDKYDILRNNLFLGDGMSVKGRGTFLLEFNSLQSEIIITAPLIIAKDSVQFIINAGTYVLPVHSISSRKIRYGVMGVSEEIGPEVPSVAPGVFSIVSGELPTGCLRVFTDTATAAGIGNSGQLTLQNLPLLMSRKSLDSKDSIVAALNNIVASAGILPDKVTIAGYEDPEYQSGIVPYQDEDETVQQFRFGGYADTRFHKGCVVSEFYYDGADPYAGELYRYHIENPVYAVVTVRTWIDGDDGEDVPFTFDYVHNILTTSHKRVRVAILTTDPASWDYVRQAFTSLYSSGGSIRLLPYFSIRYYVDETNVDAGIVSDVNECLMNYLDKGPSYRVVSYAMLVSNIKEVTGAVPTGIKYKYPDGTGGILTSGLTSGLVPTYNINYAPSEFNVSIPLTILNTIAVGGYLG